MTRLKPSMARLTYEILRITKCPSVLVLYGPSCTWGACWQHAEDPRDDSDRGILVDLGAHEWWRRLSDEDVEVVIARWAVTRTFDVTKRVYPPSTLRQEVALMQTARQ